MRTFLQTLLAACFLLCGPAFSASRGPAKVKTVNLRPETLDQAFAMWQSTERLIRDRRVTRKDARLRFTWAYDLIKERSEITDPTKTWAFPLLGLKRGKYFRGSYQPAGFDFYAGSGKGAIHPAVDIFVHDRRQREVDDATGKPVSVVAAFDSVVVAAQPGWKVKDRTKGGVYCYLLQPASGHLIYYAHLKEINVVLGQVVKKGQVIGLLGRTGRNARKKRSETHLHYMIMKFEGGKFSILNPLKRLPISKRLPDPDDRTAGISR